MGVPADTIDTVVRLLPHVEIAHHIPGRIRLRVLPSGYWLAQQGDIGEAVQEIPGVHSIRVNTAARSITIEYDREKVPRELWEKIEQLKDRPELGEEIAAQLRELVA